MKTFINYWRAEFQKLRHTPVYYLVLVGGLLVSLIVGFAHAIDVHALAVLGQDPWSRFLTRGIAVYALFILCPFIVLLVSSVMYVEQRASAWKMLYTLPAPRAYIYWSKYLLLLSLLLISSSLVLISLPLMGYLLHLFYPEYELIYHQPDLSKFFLQIGHITIASLGLLSWHYCLSTLFRHFLIPIGIGFVGLILGFIMTLTQQPIAHYLPYSYPMFILDFGAFPPNELMMEKIMGLQRCEWYSLGYALLFSLLGFLYERKRIVSN